MPVNVRFNASGTGG